MKKTLKDMENNRRKINIVVGIILLGILLISFGAYARYKKGYAIPNEKIIASLNTSQLNNMQVDEEKSSKNTNINNKENSDGDEFANSAFIGNSCVEGLNSYGIVNKADFYSRVGLTVKSVFTKSTLKGNMPIINELDKKQYDKVFLLFGENELGWEYPEAFIKDYEKVIDVIKSSQPKAKIYLQSIFPVSREVAEKNIEQTNNDRIEEYNMLLQKLSLKKQVRYLDVASVLKDESGNLKKDAAADGVHLKQSYCKIWVEYLKNNM